MQDLYVIIIGIYTLFFSLPDLIGEERTVRLEFWWLNKAKQSLRLIVEYGKLIVKFIIVCVKSGWVTILVYTPFILLWLFYDNIKIFLKEFTLKKVFLQILTVNLLLSFLYMILFLVSALGAILISSEANRLWKNIAKELDNVWEKWKKKFLPMVPISIIFYIKLFGFVDRLSDRITSYEYGKRGLVLPTMLVQLLVGGGLLIFLKESELIKTIAIIICSIVVIIAILNIPTLLYGTSTALIAFVVIVELAITVMGWIIIVIPWFVLFAPPIFLNRIAQITGQPMYLKVGKYLVVLIGIILALIYG